MRELMCFAGCALALILLPASLDTAWGQTPRTVWDGVYSAEQAARGDTAYRSACLNCHGPELRGGGGGASPTLRTDEFIDRWREDNLTALFDKMKTTMPRNNQRGTLGEDTYLAILAFLFQANEFPAGSQPLTLADLGSTRLQARDGPKPLPNGSQISTVGCLTPAGPEWSLTRAADPVRNRRPDQTDPQEVEAFGKAPIGSLTFQLRNIDFISPSFDPAPHSGHKVLVKGVVSRTGATSRISTNLIVMLSEACAP